MSSAAAPSLALLRFARGPEIDLQPGKVHLLMWFDAKRQLDNNTARFYEETTELAEKYLNEIVFIAVASGSIGKDEKALAKAVNLELCDEETGVVFRRGWPFVALDGNDFTKKMYNRIQPIDEDSVFGVAFTVIDKQGKVVASLGTGSLQELESAFAPLLETPKKGKGKKGKSG